MQNKRRNNCIRRKAGFTLVETLLVVGIILILLTLSILLVSRHAADLRQEEMDSKAEIIYTAAQNRLAVLRANGNEHKYQYQVGGDVTPLGYIPQDFDNQISDREYAKNPLYYVSSRNKDGISGLECATTQILPQGAVDYALWENNWVIEYEPGSGRVYAVFYSEERDLEELIAQGKLNTYRYSRTRRNNGGYVGYYGGDMSLDEMVTELKPFITVENGEKLIFTFQCASPDGRPLKFTVQVSDGINEQVFTVTTQAGRICQYVWVADDLTQESTQFKNQCPKLVPGRDISVKLTAESAYEQTGIDKKTTEPVVTNSLFGHSSSDYADTALILCARHLQNLDRNFSGVRGITNAAQKADISFAYDAANDKNWYALYNNKPFQPINNFELTSYYGSFVEDNNLYYTTIQGLHTVSATDNGGLFAVMYGGDYKGIHMVNATVTAEGSGMSTSAGSAGGLAGRISGSVMIQDCRVYWDPIRAYQNKDKTWISGQNAGGLVGYIPKGNELVIETSFAAMVVWGKSVAGGLVGNSNGKVVIRNSYADCYLTASAASGLLVSTGTVEIRDAYAAGYIHATNDAAGLVLGNANVTNAYSACVFTSDDHDCVYTTVNPEGSTASNVYYLAMAGADIKNFAQTSAKTYEELSSPEMAAAMGVGFTNNVQSNPYNLRDQGLSDYSFPGLSKIPHYGDWQADFESGTLVYYEEYFTGERYGFFGGNMDTLQKEGYVKGDGYGIIFSAPVTGVIVKYEGSTLHLTEYYEVKNDGASYFIYPLPKHIVNQAPGSSFLRSLTIMSGTEETVSYFNPHFAKVITSNPETENRRPISIRTARQLHLLSLYYSQYASATQNATFSQEMDICYQGDINGQEYDWKTYWGSDDRAEGTKVNSQRPIGSGGQPFSAKYDGGNKKIYNLNISTGGDTANSQYVGLFGYVAEGASVTNVVLVSDYYASVGQSGKLNEGVVYASPDKPVYIGALVGYNEGDITNCAVSGYSTVLSVYSGTRVFYGGFAGANDGRIYDCSVVSAGTDLNITNSYAYAGGFIGVNYSAIGRCYTFSALQVLASKDSGTIVAGFAAQNNMGSIQSSYCGTSLVSSGTASSSAFAPRGGAVTQGYYLTNGAYYLANTLYAFQSNPKDTAGEALSDQQMEDMILSGSSGADHAYMHDNTREDSFGYPAVVKDADGKFVHYGDWIVAVDLGDMGIFYWEKEEYGSNNGVHFSYISIDVDEKGVETLLQGSNLCKAHDDGGRITAYGYGYFYAGDTAAVISMENVDVSALLRNEQIEKELKSQMQSFNFVAFTSGAAAEQLKPVEKNANLVWTVGDHSFTVSPFFADAMSYDGKQGLPIQSVKPGVEGEDGKNPYQIRSPEQLQFINWNYLTGTYDYSVDVTNDGNARGFNYLRYRMANPNGNENNNQGTGYNFFWLQSHDLDFDHDPQGGNAPYAPIGSLYDANSNQESSQATMAYFAGAYNGDDYTIKNVEISSEAGCVGLFGVAMEARLENIAMYSDRNNRIQITGNKALSYFVGGLVGLAGKGGSQEAIFKNCAVAGYRIEDHRGEDGGWAGGNIGGLVGATNMDISSCSAVTDIKLAFTYTSRNQKNVRVGGIVGNVRATISNCYAGGSIVSVIGGETTGVNSHPNIYVGGISGGIVMRTQGNFTDLMGGTEGPITIKNCYSFVKLPEPGKNWVWRAGSIATIGEMAQEDVRNYTEIQSLDIYNSYCLRDAVLFASDYTMEDGVYANQTDWDKSKGEQFEYVRMRNWFMGAYYERITTIYNDHSPYLSYEEMCTVLADYLNDYAKAELNASEDVFHSVTTEENGALVPGKYSFPGVEYLDGRDYPFPTMLTQTDRFTVGEAAGTQRLYVHYGAWPMVGMYWGQYQADLDMFVYKNYHAAGSSDPAQQVILVLNGDVDISAFDPDKQQFAYSYMDAKGQTVTDPENAPARVIGVSDAVLVTDESSPFFGKHMVTVTLEPRKTGTVTITPITGEVANALTVKVTAELRIVSEPVQVEQSTGDSTLVQLFVTDKNGIVLPEAKNWTVGEIFDPEVAGVEKVNTAEAGCIALKVTAYRPGESFVDVTVELDGYTGQLLLVVQTDVGSSVGISNGADFNQAQLGFANASGTKTEFTENRPVLDGAGCFLYANCDISKFEILSVSVNGAATTDYALGPVVSDGLYSYRQLAVSQTGSVQVVLERAGIRYTLTMDAVTAEQLYTLTLHAGNGQFSNGKQQLQQLVAENWTVEALEAPVFPVNTAVNGEAYSWQHIFDGWYWVDGTRQVAVAPGEKLIPGREYHAKWKYVCLVAHTAFARPIQQTREMTEDYRITLPKESYGAGLDSDRIQVYAGGVRLTLSAQYSYTETATAYVLEMATLYEDIVILIS